MYSFVLQHVVCLENVVLQYIWKKTKKGDNFPEGTYSLFSNNHQSQMHKEAGGKLRKKSGSHSSGKKKSSFHGLKELFHGFVFTGVTHSQEPLLDTYSRFTSSNFHIYVHGALKYFQKKWSQRTTQIQTEGLGGFGWWSIGPGKGL